MMAALGPPFTFAQISPPEAPSHFASFTQSGETSGLRRKALNLVAVPTRAGDHS
jgi:hypothetical protein